MSGTPTTAAVSHGDLVPPRGSAWDLLVVGGGSAGIVAARTAAGLGASVLMVERDRTGGECLWTGCVPSKALLAAAVAAAAARHASVLGVTVDGVRVDFAAVMGHVRAAMTAIAPGDSPQALARSGVRVAAGAARFTGPASAEVNGRPVRFRQAVVATGSAPQLPPIAGLAEAHPLTSDTMWTLTELPSRLVVLGGGSAGCELGQAFARLGSTVTLIEAGPRILIREDSAATQLVTTTLEHDGVTIHTGATVATVRIGTVNLTGGERIGFDRLLVAAGRRPRSADLGLAAAGVDVDEDGYVQVDAHLRTTNRRIWAVGDVTRRPAFTHTAGVDGGVAASNAILGLRRRADPVQPRVTYTAPELAAVGLATGGACPRPGLHVRTVAHRHIDRAVTDADTDGMTRLVLDRRGRILGATVVAPRAGEMLAELALAVRRGMTVADLAGTTHAYPTYSQAPWLAAILERRSQLSRPVASRAVAALARARRRWLDRPPRHD